MSFDWSHYLIIAEELFREAENTTYKDAHLRCAISRAYYAAFHTAKLKLYEKWYISVSRDASAHKEVKEYYQQKNMKMIALNLERMRIDRNKADYHDIVKDLEAVTQENLKRANQVISALSRL
jgi:uncharacterized protein (UPF0332 family)